MSDDLIEFKLHFVKVPCKNCKWTLARDYSTNGGDVEIKMGNGRLILDGLPKGVFCGRCGVFNSTEDMEQSRDTAKEATLQQIRGQQ